MNLNHLAIFHAVAQAGSMTLGAERLDISQPAVSKQVQELERVLGVHLFDRIGRRVHLSQAGEILADYSQRLFALVHEAETAMADVRAVGRGKLTIGASTTIGTYLLPGVVAEFWRRHPRIELLVQIENTEQVHRRLAGHELDLGLTEGLVEEEELEAEVFHQDELVVIAAPGHRLGGQPRVPVSAVQEEPFILREPGSGTRAVQERAHRAPEVTGPGRHGAGQHRGHQARGGRRGGPGHRLAAVGARRMCRGHPDDAAGRRATHREGTPPGPSQGPARRTGLAGILRRSARDNGRPIRVEEGKRTVFMPVLGFQTHENRPSWR